MKDRPIQIAEAMSNLINQHPFFATYLFLIMKVVYRPDMPTAATNGVTIYLGDWFLNLSIRERVFVLAHEILHSILGHIPRAKAFADRGIGPDGKPFNRRRCDIATDYVINSALVAAKVGDMPEEGCIRQENDHLKTWEDVYTELKDSKDPKDPKDPKADKPSIDLHLDPSEGTPSGEELKQAITQARNAAVAAGNMPKELQHIIGEILEPTLPWPHILRDFVTRLVGKDETTWRRLNRRRLSTCPDFPSPGRDGCQINCIVAAVDVSGSISKEMLDQFMSELWGIAEEVRPREFFIAWFDTEVHMTQIKEPEDLRTQDVYGGGGTDWNAVPRAIREHDLDPDVLITLTDGYVQTITDFPPWPSITVTTGDPLPFGKNIEIKL